MATVTVTGRISTTYLAAGQTVTVEHTDQIDALAAAGWITIEHADTLPAKPAPAADPNEPGRNASRDAWAEFLADRGVEFTETDTRDDLVALWDLTGE